MMFGPNRQFWECTKKKGLRVHTQLLGEGVRNKEDTDARRICRAHILRSCMSITRVVEVFHLLLDLRRRYPACLQNHDQYV